MLFSFELDHNRQNLEEMLQFKSTIGKFLATPQTVKVYLAAISHTYVNHTWITRSHRILLNAKAAIVQSGIQLSHSQKKDKDPAKLR